MSSLIHAGFIMNICINKMGPFVHWELNCHVTQRQKKLPLRKPFYLSRCPLGCLDKIFKMEISNLFCWLVSGPWFNIKMPSYQYRKSHCGDKTVVRSSYLHNGISYTGMMTSLYWIEALVVIGWILRDLTGDEWTLVEIMVRCLQKPNHYLSQCCPGSVLPYVVTKPQWVKYICKHFPE